MKRRSPIVLIIAASTILNAVDAQAARRAHTTARPRPATSQPANANAGNSGDQSMHFGDWTITDDKDKVVGTWTWDPSKQGFTAKWTNGIENAYHLDVFSASNVELSGTDSEGATVKFIGSRRGNTAEGSSVTESVSGSSTWKWKASWSDNSAAVASNKPAAGSPTSASPTSASPTSATTAPASSSLANTSAAPANPAIAATNKKPQLNGKASLTNGRSIPGKNRGNGGTSISSALDAATQTSSPPASNNNASSTTSNTAAVKPNEIASTTSTTSTTSAGTASTTAGSSGDPAAGSSAATNGTPGTTSGAAKKPGKRFPGFKQMANMLIDTLAQPGGAAGSAVAPVPDASGVGSKDDPNASTGASTGGSSGGGSGSSGGGVGGVASGLTSVLGMAASVAGGGGGALGSVGSIASMGAGGAMGGGGGIGGFGGRGNSELAHELQMAQQAEQAGDYYNAAHDWWYSIDLAVGGRGYKERQEFMETGEVTPGLHVRDVYKHSLRCHLLMYRKYLGSGFDPKSGMGEHVYTGLPEEFTKDYTCLQFADPNNPTWFYLGATNYVGGTDNPLKYVHAYWLLDCGLTCTNVPASLKAKIDALKDHIRMAATLELADLDRAKYENMIAQIQNQENPTISIFKDSQGKVLHVIDSSAGMYKFYYPMMKEMIKNDYPSFKGKFERLVAYCRSLPNNAAPVPPSSPGDGVDEWGVRQIEEKAFGPVEYKTRNFI